MRRKTTAVRVGNHWIGGDHPVLVQSMASVDTNDTQACVEQALRIAAAGGELVRFTAQGRREAENLRNIRDGLRARGCDIPLSADIHFNPEAAFVAAQIVEKVRINPGNFGDDPAKFIRLLDRCKQHGTALRIGVNHGSLAERIVAQHGDTPAGMVESAMEFLRVCVAEGFDQVVVSMKSSNVGVMVEAYRRLAAAMDAEAMAFPLHLGVTEAGDGEDGRIKSAVGIGTLLVDGLGDTIRVSLTEPPENEIPVAFSILQAARVRISRTEYIACPGCGRTLFDLPETLARVKAATAHLTGLKIAVMGCIVNGPGEMADADYGYVGAGPGRVTLYKGKEIIKRNILQGQAIEELLSVINSQ
jgi:(E)-4-hydroxy-3-methylbut-2-enyl-diphosphate synthase